MSGFPFCIGGHRIACILIRIAEWEGAAGDLEADPVAWRKSVAEIIEIDTVILHYSRTQKHLFVEAVSVSGADDGEDLTAKIHCLSIRIYIEQTGHEVGVSGI